MPRASTDLPPAGYRDCWATFFGAAYLATSIALLGIAFQMPDLQQVAAATARALPSALR
jgi:hypothetical protein